ncbi:hypothetical protein H632_c2766p0, partial [Helicosporidium sp. ATCC 50920]
LSGAASPQSSAELATLLAEVGAGPLLVAFRGRVRAPRPLLCELGECEAALVALGEERCVERRRSSIWLKDREPVRESVRKTQWTLQDDAGPGVQVQDAHRARGDALELVADVYLPAQMSTADASMAKDLGCRVVGSRLVERALPVGAWVTAVGEASLEGGGGTEKQPSIVLRSPGRGLGPSGGGSLHSPALWSPAKDQLLLTRHPIDVQILALQHQAQAVWRLAAALGLVGGCALGLLLWRRVASWTERRRMRRRLREARQRWRKTGRLGGSGRDGEEAAAEAQLAPQAMPWFPDRFFSCLGLSRSLALGSSRSSSASSLLLDEPCDLAPPSSSPDAREALCVACLDTRATHCFTGCGHLCACEGCVENMERCPLCRVESATVRVFVV